MVELWLSIPLPEDDAKQPDTENDLKELENEISILRSPSCSTSIKMDPDAELPLNFLAGSSTEPNSIEDTAKITKSSPTIHYSINNNVSKPNGFELPKTTTSTSICEPNPIVPITSQQPVANNTHANSIPETNSVTPIKLNSLLLSSGNGVAIPGTGQPKVLLPANKKFMKCIDKNGRVSLIEVVVDPNNPKILRMVIPTAQSNKGLTPVVSGPNKPIASNQNAKFVVRPTQKTISLSSGNKVIPITNLENTQRALSETSTKLIVKPSNNITSTMVLNPQNTPPSTVQPKLITAVKPTIANATIATPIPIKTQIVNTASPKPFTSFSVATVANSNQQKPPSNSKTMLMKNGNIFVFNSPGAKPQQRQQSLLKPQISLLRSPLDSSKTNQPSLLNVDNPNVKIVTVKSVTGMENRKINVFVPSDDKAKLFNSGGRCADRNAVDGDVGGSKKKYIFNTKLKRQYAQELEDIFLQMNGFTCARGAICWLLRRIPLITPLASKHRYQESFPFVVDSEQTFRAMFMAKRRSNEVSHSNSLANKIKYGHLPI